MNHKPTAIQFLMLRRRKAVRRYQNENDQRKHVQMGQCAGNISVQGLDKQGLTNRAITRMLRLNFAGTITFQMCR